MMNKEKFSLKYPQKFAISRYYRKIVLNEGDSIYYPLLYPAPCYVLEDHKKYDENGVVEQSARVLMQWERVDEPDGVTTIKANEITNENYRNLIREKTTYVNRLFDTYEECKIEVEKEIEKNLSQERLKYMYSGESLDDVLLKAEMAALEGKKEQNKLVLATDEIYQKTLGDNAATNSTKDKKLDGSAAQQVMSALTKDENLSSVAKGLKNAKDKEVRTLVDDDGQNEFCC